MLTRDRACLTIYIPIRFSDHFATKSGYICAYFDFKEASITPNSYLYLTDQQKEKKYEYESGEVFLICEYVFTERPEVIAKYTLIQITVNATNGFKVLAECEEGATTKNQIYLLYQIAHRTLKELDISLRRQWMKKYKTVELENLDDLQEYLHMQRDNFREEFLADFTSLNQKKVLTEKIAITNDFLEKVDRLKRKNMEEGLICL